MSRRPVPGRGRSLVVVAILAVIAAALLIVFVLRLAQQPGAKVNLGSQEFDVGRAATFAPSVASKGPLLFQALRGSLDLYVQHQGTDPQHGWSAFEAHAPGAPRSCLLQWQRGTHDFRDPCTQRAVSADGAGLDQYPVQVDANGHVIVNLRQPTGRTPSTQ